MLVACGGKSIDGSFSGKRSRKNGGPSGGQVTKNIERSNSFQVKDVALLRNSVESCMGLGFLAITEDMLLPATVTAVSEPLKDDRIRFLLPSLYKVGDDIIDKERGNLVDLSGSGRTSVTADGLTDTYLRSLEAVANVVAHHCSLDTPECQCGTKPQAKVLLSRCLPGLDPDTKEMDDASEMLGLVCSEGAKGMRKAIASMIASYAFAASR
jgi:hypothetical protein